MEWKDNLPLEKEIYYTGKKCLMQLSVEYFHAVQFAC